MTREPVELVTCSFCGHTYDAHSAAGACASCPLGSSCAGSCCPRCGYENARPPKWLGRLLARLRPAPDREEEDDV